jgi:two-component system sensor histidine kinase KdpD
MMAEYRRPNPDELLARVQAEERQQRRGKMKIFLGYAAGVGKTYAMLDAARARQADQVDVVIGYAETHGRAETEALLQGLEIIPRKQVEYRGKLLPEMDVDAVLARQPQLAVVDELAHTNVPGSRHPKRHQDVEELLAAGIDVYTTLNIQHLESLNDVIAQITGVVVRETIPDSAVDEASEVELIDLAPDELLQRLKEGKVYVPEQAARAIEKFFRKGNLTALREIALRRTATCVDEKMRAYMETRAIAGPWPAAERLLVCVSPGALSERLIRTARRLAEELNAEWFAVYVETPGQTNLLPQQRDHVAQMLHLAEELGAKVLTLPGYDVAETVVNYARAHNITKIIAGKPIRSRWVELLRGSMVVDQIIRQSGNIDVYVISGGTETSPAVSAIEWQPHRPFRRYLLSLLLVAAATLLGLPIRANISPVNLVMLYLVAVVVAAIYLGRGPSILTAVLSVLALDFFFVPPLLTFAVADVQYILTFVGLLVVGLVISALTVRVREQADAVQRREAQTAELYEFTRDLAAASGVADIMRAVITHLSQTFSREIVILLPEGETLQPRAVSPEFTLSENELAVAMWAYQHGEAAGRSTDTLPAAAARYLPLKTARGVIGVLGVKPTDPSHHLTPEQRRLLESFATQAALAIERAQLAEQARRAQMLEVTEKLQAALLNSISHDLRTPLASITGSLSSLQEEALPLDEATRRSLLENASAEAERLNHLVGNLLDMTRIEARAMKVTAELCEVQDVVGSALQQMGDRLEGRLVQADVPASLPLVLMDFVLIVQVLSNLLDNALKYSPADQPIEVHAGVTDGRLELQVADRGIGIPPEDLTRVFDKFYRVQRPNGVSGTGLGLAICKGIVEAHRGEIAAANRDGGGTVITVALPLVQEQAA